MFADLKRHLGTMDAKHGFSREGVLSVLRDAFSALQKRLNHPHSDKEFLPAALEILETPPSPVHMGFMLTICAFVVVALLWSFFGRIDIVAVAQGKIQPAGRIKVVQPLETGKIIKIFVENGAAVKAGDLLIELEPSEARAEEAASAAAFASFEAEALRRRAALAAAEAGDYGAAPIINWPANIPGLYRSREERVLKGDFAQLAASANSLTAQLAQKQAESKRLEQTIAAQESIGRHAAAARSHAQVPLQPEGGDENRADRRA